jgi:hypothetical protein
MGSERYEDLLIYVESEVPELDPDEIAGARATSRIYSESYRV